MHEYCAESNHCWHHDARPMVWCCFAMTMTENVSLVVLRQVSIIFGVVMGDLLLKENWHVTRSAEASFLSLPVDYLITQA